MKNFLYTMGTRQALYAVVVGLCVLSLGWYTLRPSAGWGEKSYALASEEVVLDASGIDVTRKVDFGKYKYRDVIPAEDLHLDDPNRRVIIVGDIHGMYKPFQQLLKKLDYTPGKDTLFHVGDVLAKGPDSEKVLDWLVEHKIKGVRGNHDQKVIGWRIWQNWVESFPGGAQFLKRVEKLTHADVTSSTKLKHKLSKSDRARLKQHAFPSSRDWVWGSEHYWLARHLSAAQFEYLVDLPLIVELSAVGGNLVHAGILPRMLEEERPDAWALMNIRSVLKGGEASRKFDGTPWTEVFNAYQDKLAASSGEAGGADTDMEGEGELKEKKPQAVVFGHAAKLGLQVTRWALGLDTGCVYGRELTAVVLQGGRGGAAGEGDGREVKVGNWTGRLWSVACEAP